VRQQSTTVQQKMARIANRRWGAATRAELFRAGLTPAELRQQMKVGALIRVYPGVYRVGHAAPCLEASYLTAVLACGDEALLSGRPAAYFLELIKGRPPAPEVSAPSKRRVRGVRTRQRRGVQGTKVRGIPVTTVAQTLVDLAAELDVDELARACHEAGVRYRTTPAQVERILARHPNTRGAGKLRAIVRGDAKVTLSRLERRFLDLLRENGLPLPETNKVASGRRVDCRWPEHKLTVELDSYRFHNTRHAWEQDRRREREARRRLDDFIRYTHDDVFENPAPMLAELSARF
jgi:hypothetical protein